MERCLGMVHGNSGSMCGVGYRGTKCGTCDVNFFTNPTTAACLPCSDEVALRLAWTAASNGTNVTGTRGAGGGDLMSKIVPFLWLLLGFVGGLGVTSIVVILIQKKVGGTFGRGIARAVDFMCYVVVLSQSTLYVANTASIAVSNGESGFFGGAGGLFSSSLFAQLNAFQLDFSYAVKYDCIAGVDARWMFNKAYAAVVSLVVVMYVSVLVVVNRSRVIRRVLNHSPDNTPGPIVTPQAAALAQAKRQRNNKTTTKTENSHNNQTSGGVTVKAIEAVAAGETGEENKGRNPSKREILVVYVLRKFTVVASVLLYVSHAVSCRVALSALYCDGIEGDEYDTGDADDCRRLPGATKAGMWGLFLIHCVGFPLFTFIFAHRVRRNHMGGVSCCNDSTETEARSEARLKTRNEVSFYRFFLESSLEPRRHFFRGISMSVILVLVLTESLMKPPNQSTAAEIGSVELRRSCVQAAAVCVYFVLLCTLQPYVRMKMWRWSRARHWKQYVTTFNKATTIILILSRLLVEQARVYIQVQEEAREETGEGTGDRMMPTGATNSTSNALPRPLLSSPLSTTRSATAVNETPALFAAGLAFMYISTACFLLQYAVLFVLFFLSLVGGARREEKKIVIVRRQKQHQLRLLLRPEGEGGGGGESAEERRDGEGGIEMMTANENPMMGMSFKERKGKGNGRKEDTATKTGKAGVSEEGGGGMEHSIGSLRFAATARTNTSAKKKKKASKGKGKNQIQVVEEEEQGGEEGDEEKDDESVTILIGERTKHQSQKFGEMSSDGEDDDDGGKYGSEAAVKPRLYSKKHSSRQQAYSSTSSTTSSGASSTPAPNNISTSTAVDDVGGARQAAVSHHSSRQISIGGTSHLNNPIWVGAATAATAGMMQTQDKQVSAVTPTMAGNESVTSELAGDCGKDEAHGGEEGGEAGGEGEDAVDVLAMARAQLRNVFGRMGEGGAEDGGGQQQYVAR